MNDLGFVQRCISADKGSWDEFVEKYSRLIYNYIRAVLEAKGLQPDADTAAEIFQEFFLFISKDNFKKLSTYKAKNGCSLASWLRQVTVNFTLDYARKLKVQAVSLDAQNEDGINLHDALAHETKGSFDQRMGANERIDELKECIQRLDADEKYFMLLYTQEGLNLERIRQIMGISRSAVDMRKARLFDKIRECFRKKGFEV